MYIVVTGHMIICFIRIVSIKKQDVINDEEVRAERMGFY